LASALLNPADPPETVVSSFYSALQQEVNRGNPFLDDAEQELLRGHHPFIVDPGNYPPGLVAAVHNRRRTAPVKAIRESSAPTVLDAGCGCGSDSILFAALGASVVAVNVSSDELAVAEKRARYYEKVGGVNLNIRFIQDDLNDYLPGEENFSLTWFASVLAVIRDQESLLKRVFQATRDQGRIMLVDYNLLHPPFLWKEWRRRNTVREKCPDFAREGHFWKMVRRKGRMGGRFFPLAEGGLFDDAQFFTPGTLRALLQRAGFRVLPAVFSGCALPAFPGPAVFLERALSRVPGWKSIGRAYLITGVK
jgi:SAM-dependent methyltransferase